MMPPARSVRGGGTPPIAIWRAWRDPETIGRVAAERALRQLGARPVPTQEVPVVWDPEAAREFLYIIAEAASGDARYRGFSFLIDREGDALASPVADDRR